jgi:lysine biosynthesis protein LysW
MERGTEVTKATQTIQAGCRDCKHEITLGDIPKKGQRVACPACWAYLEIVSLDPLELAWEIEEDWLVE